MHICADTGSGVKFRVQRISLRDGKQIAIYHPYDDTTGEEPMTQPQSDWQEHLQAIREGKLELLGTETAPNYKYEVNLEDGTKRVFQYGGGEPLKRS
jgi:hypothetical protein